MKNKIIIISFVFFALLSLMLKDIYFYEKGAKEGRFIAFELAKEPRKLLKGNVFDIKLKKQLFPYNKLIEANESGYIVLYKKKGGDWEFKDFFKEQPLNKNEVIIKYYLKYDKSIQRSLGELSFEFSRSKIDLPFDIAYKIDRFKSALYLLDNGGNAVFCGFLDRFNKPIIINKSISFNKAVDLL